jgi:hypothetical protein
MQESSLIARENFINNKKKAKTGYDKNQNEIKIDVGDKVLIKNHVRKGKLSHK